MNEDEEQPVQLVTQLFLLLSENTSFNGLFLKMQQNPAYMNLYGQCDFIITCTIIIVIIIIIIIIVIIIIKEETISKSRRFLNERKGEGREQEV